VIREYEVKTLEDLNPKEEAALAEAKKSWFEQEYNSAKECMDVIATRMSHWPTHHRIDLELIQDHDMK
jgi:hypothetical protein